MSKHKKNVEAEALKRAQRLIEDLYLQLDSMSAKVSKIAESLQAIKINTESDDE